MYDMDLIMPDEVKAFLDDKADTNRKCGYEMFKVIDIDRDPVDTPDGEMYSDNWAVTMYNTISCMCVSNISSSPPFFEMRDN